MDGELNEDDLDRLLDRKRRGRSPRLRRWADFGGDAGYAPGVGSLGDGGLVDGQDGTGAVDQGEGGGL